MRIEDELGFPFFVRGQKMMKEERRNGRWEERRGETESGRRGEEAGGERGGSETYKGHHRSLLW